MLGLLVSIAAWTWATPAHATALVVGVEGMNCAEGCPPRVTRALEAVDGIDQVIVDFASNAACLETRAAISEAALQAALATESYTLGTIEAVERCVTAQPVVASTPRDPWHDTAGVDARIISDGQRVELDAHVVPQKFTIFDFGASWCGPCHIVADELRAQLRTHEDLAVRAISLGDDASKSFDLPVAVQHLQFASGLPWFIVLSPHGRRIYEGPHVDKALKAIQRRRK